MGLGADEVGVVREFQDLHDGLVRSLAGEDQSAFFELLDITGIDFVAVAETHALGGMAAKELGGDGIGFDLDVASPQTHIAAQPFYLFLFGKNVDDGDGRVGFDFGAVGVLDTADVTGEFQDRHLESEAETQVGQVVLARVADGGDLAFGAARAETAGYDDAVHIAQFGGGVVVRDIRGLDPLDLDVTAQGDARVFQGVDNGGIAVAHGGVFAGDADRNTAFRLADAIAYINDQLPQNEQIGQALRREVRMFPEIAIRELVANALIHQDFNVTGAGPM